MEFLYFPEDKTEYIPGIISIIIVFILSLVIIWLLVKASRKQVKELKDQGFPVIEDKGFKETAIIEQETIVEKTTKREHTKTKT